MNVISVITLYLFNLITFLANNLYCFVKESEKNLSILKFSSETEEWECLSQPNPIAFHENSKGLFLDDKYIVITGGKLNVSEIKNTEMESTSECLIYSIKKNRFYSFPELNLERHSHCIGYLDGCIYVFGGKSENDFKGINSSVEKIEWTKIKSQYDLICDPSGKNSKKETSTEIKWSEIEPFNNFRYNAMIFLMNKEFYLIGGIDRSNKICKKIEKFNPENNHWSLVKWKIPIYTHSSSLIALSNCELLLLGGSYNNSNKINSIIRLNFETQKYIFKTSTSHRLFPKLLITDKNLYILGEDKETSCEKIILKDFTSFIAAESYTIFVNNPLTSFPSSDIIPKLDFYSMKLDIVKNEEEEDRTYKIIEDYESLYLIGTIIYPCLVELNIQKEKISLKEIDFHFKFYNYGSAVRLNEYFIISMGGTNEKNLKSSKQVQLINLKNFNSKKLQKMRNGRLKFESIIVEGKIFVCGGVAFSVDNTETYLKSCECYSIKDDVWSQIHDMNSQRFNFSISNYKNLIYAFGGCDGLNFLDSIEYYEINTNIWKENNRVNLNDLLTLHRSYLIDENLALIFGGTTPEKCINDVWILNFKENRKKVLCKMHENRMGHRIFKNSNNLIILGGNKNGSKVENFRINKYDIKTEYFKDFTKELSKNYLEKNLDGFQNA